MISSSVSKKTGALLLPWKTCDSQNFCMAVILVSYKNDVVAAHDSFFLDGNTMITPCLFDQLLYLPLKMDCMCFTEDDLMPISFPKITKSLAPLFCANTLNPPDDIVRIVKSMICFILKAISQLDFETDIIMLIVFNMSMQLMHVF